MEKKWNEEKRKNKNGKNKWIDLHIYFDLWIDQKGKTIYVRDD